MEEKNIKQVLIEKAMTEEEVCSQTSSGVFDENGKSVEKI